MHVHITYCSMWGYEPKAVSLAATLLTTFKQEIKDLTLVPAGGGCFEVKFDHDLVWSKLKTKEFPLEEAMVSLAKKRLHA